MDTPPAAFTVAVASHSPRSIASHTRSINVSLDPAGDSPFCRHSVLKSASIIAFTSSFVAFFVVRSPRVVVSSSSSSPPKIVFAAPLNSRIFAALACRHVAGRSFALTNPSPSAPNEMLERPPGGACVRVVGRSVRTLPLFWFASARERVRGRHRVRSRRARSATRVGSRRSRAGVVAARAASRSVARAIARARTRFINARN